MRQQAHHPFHMHGFSIQPLTLSNGVTTFTWPYHEFRDNVDIPPGYTLTFRVRIDDRPMPDGTTARWCARALAVPLPHLLPRHARHAVGNRGRSPQRQGAPRHQRELHTGQRQPGADGDRQGNVFRRGRRTGDAVILRRLDARRWWRKLHMVVPDRHGTQPVRVPDRDEQGWNKGPDSVLPRHHRARSAHAHGARSTEGKNRQHAQLRSLSDRSRCVRDDRARRVETARCAEVHRQPQPHRASVRQAHSANRASTRRASAPRTGSTRR